MCELLNTLDRPYFIERVALDGVAGIRNARRAVLEAFRAQVEGKGYSFVEILAACPTYQRLTPSEAMRFVGGAISAAFPVRPFRVNGEKVDA